SSLVSTLRSDPGRVNEPADVQIHPGGHTVYVNNRGEDAIAWFSIAPDGALHREGHVSLSASVHPGLAARSLAVSPRGDYLLVSDRPAGLVRSYGIVADGSLTPRGEFPVPGAAFVCIVPAATGTGEGAAV
ncbi:MAG: beta-propeller fold lactonase family protein, partial [Paracoccaceae bacterium]